ncbi:MAG: spermidine/putrescine ABC transporter substrate-binding protein [Tissierellia bacterium]|nr:spermidine/putrescine ABC transporter substrate-binding protein [Tissierellia bacterium]
MKKIILVLMLILLTGCAGSDSENVVNVYNWGEYMDKDILKDFEAETGIKVKYDTFVTNEDLYVKMKKGGDSYDVIIPSEYMIERMIGEDMLQKLDKEKLENLHNIDPKLLNMDYDPDSEYSIPYLWGTLGIVYNKNKVDGEVESWDILWDKKYENEIVMLDSSRDSIGIALKRLGYSMNTKDEKELEEARNLLVEQKPLVLAYQVDQTKDIMVGEEASIAVMYSGDAYDAIRQNDNLEYIIPKEGSNLWFDSMVIPSNAKNIDNAYKFIDYICKPEVAAKLADYVGYSTPNLECKDLLEPEMRESEVAFPNLDELNDMEVFNNPGETVIIYDKIWTDVISE